MVAGYDAWRCQDDADCCVELCIFSVEEYLVRSEVSGVSTVELLERRRIFGSAKRNVSEYMVCNFFLDLSLILGLSPPDPYFAPVRSASRDPGTETIPDQGSRSLVNMW